MDSTQTSISVLNVDLKKPDSIPTIVEEIYQKVKSINILVNIAGYTDPQPLLSTSLESMKKTYSVNVFSPFMLIRECTKYMKKSGGKILNVASTAGMTPRPGWLSYSSSKASIISMSQTLTEELSEYGIKVYCVSPGRCATNLRRKLAPEEDPNTIMQPIEVAEIICNLLSDGEYCLDGQNIVIRKQI
jgi:3-oxoacyl-[acyl-carrier protein] reductase